MFVPGTGLGLGQGVHRGWVGGDYVQNVVRVGSGSDPANSNTFMYKAGNFGQSNSEGYTLSFWVRRLATGRNESYFRNHPVGPPNSNNRGMYVWMANSNDYLGVYVYDTAGTRIGDLRGSGAVGLIPAGGNLKHVYITGSRSANVHAFYIDGVLGDSSTWGSANDIAWSEITFWSFSTFDLTAADCVSGRYADYWMDTAYWDPAVYLPKFYNGGVPLSLGADGSKPTGQQPVIYKGGSMKAADWLAGDDLGTNGGGWTVSGTQIIDL